MFKIHLGENLESKLHSYGILSVIADILYCTCVFVEYLKKKSCLWDGIQDILEQWCPSLFLKFWFLLSISLTYNSCEEMCYSGVLRRASITKCNKQLILTCFSCLSPGIDHKRMTQVNTGSSQRDCMAPINKVNFVQVNPSKSFRMTNCPLDWNVFGCESELGWQWPRPALLRSPSSAVPCVVAAVLAAV